MARIPRLGSPGWALLLGSLLVALLGLGSTFIGVASLLAPSSDRISDVLYFVVAGIILIAIAVFMFMAGLNHDDAPESLFAIDIDPRNRISPEKSVTQFTSEDRKRLDKVKTDIINAPSSAEVLEILNRKSNSDLMLANPLLQPIAFAIRPATTARYVKGVVLEALTWAGVIISLPFIFVIDLWGGGRTVMYVALRLSRRARQYRARPDKILRTDARAPVLYLRSFLDEYGTSLESYLPTTSEEKLAKHYHRYGPVIAIGNPKEDLPLLGASRLYFDQDTWQAAVLYLMSISQLIIIQAGIAPGLLWELGSVRNGLDPEKLIISLTAWEELEESKRDLRYLGFKKYAEELLGCELPPDIKTTSHISFGTGWLPRAQSEFRYAIPSVRRSRSRIKRVGAAVALAISAIVTLTLVRPFVSWVIEKRVNPETSKESTPEWKPYRLKPSPMLVDAPGEPQRRTDFDLDAEESDLYEYVDKDLNARMSYKRLRSNVRFNEENFLKGPDSFPIPGVTNPKYGTRKVDEGKFESDGKCMLAGTEYKLRGSLIVKGQELWSILIFYPSNNDAARDAAQRMLNSLKTSGD